jgi:hypothetical protein
MAKTFNDVIQSLIEVNEKLIHGKMDMRVAKQVAINTQVLINSVKAQLDILKFTKRDDSAFFGPSIKMPVMPVMTGRSNGPSVGVNGINRTSHPDGSESLPLTVDYLKKSAQLTEKEAQSLLNFCIKNGVYVEEDYAVDIYDKWIDRQPV